MDPKVPTLAQLFRDAVWKARPGELSPVEALVLLAYADHARGGDSAWVAQSRLIQRCKLRSKSTPPRIIASLVEKGWLVLLTPAQWRNRQSPTYRLVIQTAPIIGAVADEQPPRSRNEPPRSANGTAPMIGANRPDSETPLSSERPSGLSGGEASRPAAPRDAPPEEQDQPAPSGAGREEALALARRVKRRDVIISHWKQPPPATPNPEYNPGRAAASIAHLPVYERTPAAAEQEAE